MLWLDIGLGKTISSLTAIEQLLDSYKVKAALVIAPLKVIEAVWEQEARKWEHTRKLSFSCVRGTAAQRLKALLTPADIYLVNYEQIPWLHEALKTHWLDRQARLPFDMVVFDEISKMKNSTAKRVRKFTKILPYMQYRVGLTGTPAANGLIDLHGQFLMVDGGARLGPNITYYRSRWFVQDVYARKWMPRRGAIKEIEAAVSDIVLEMKTADYLSLPPLVNQDIIVEMPEDAMARYKALEKEFFTDLDSGGEIEVFSAEAKSMKCRQWANGAVYTDPEGKQWQEVHDEKVEMTKDLVESLNGKPLLICNQFRHDVPRLLKAFPQGRVLTGGDTKRIVEEWNRGEIDILIGHPASMGHGLNLQYGGNHILWFGLPWSLELYDQAIGRLLRNGQKGEAVINHRLIAKGTIEMAISEALKTKSVVQSALREAVKQYRLTVDNR
jgi:SNF2 family DNA or RNA helicase